MKKRYLPKDIIEEKIRENRKFIASLESEIPYITNEMLKAKKQIYLEELKEELNNLIGNHSMVISSSKKSGRSKNMPKKGKSKGKK